MKLVHLYPREMNIYGDTGNVLVLRRRLQWRGLAVEVTPVSVGDALPTDADILAGFLLDCRGSAASSAEQQLLDDALAADRLQEVGR